MSKEILNYPQKTEDGWYVGVSESGGESYLHSDGMVRHSTLYRNEYSGYFRTKRDALKMITKYYKTK